MFETVQLCSNLTQLCTNFVLVQSSGKSFHILSSLAILFVGKLPVIVTGKGIFRNFSQKCSQKLFPGNLNWKITFLLKWFYIGKVPNFFPELCILENLWPWKLFPNFVSNNSKEVFLPITFLGKCFPKMLPKSFPGKFILKVKFPNQMILVKITFHKLFPGLL